MARKKTTRSKNPARSQAVQQIRVVTPTIVWNHSLSFLFSSMKWMVILVAIGCTAFFGWKFLQRSFIDNPEYQLKIIKLNENDVMNERDVVEIGNIPLHESIFGVNVADVEKRLIARPEIISAHVTRQLSNTLKIEVVARKPIAWIHCPVKNMLARDQEHGFLLDEYRYIYPVPAMQFESAKNLPIIDLPSEDAHLLETGKPIECKRLTACMKLLDTARQVAGSNTPWIARIAQTELWSYTVQTKDHVVATFGLDDHERQMRDLLISMNHASSQGWKIATINLIPAKNIPVTFRDASGAIRAMPNLR